MIHVSEKNIYKKQGVCHTNAPSSQDGMATNVNLVTPQKIKLKNLTSNISPDIHII